MSRVLPNWIEGYLDIHMDSESPRSFLAWAAISTIAAALQRKVSLPFGAELYYPNFYIILVAPPGKCRKGTSVKLAKKLLEELEVPLSSSSASRKGFILDLKDSLRTVEIEKDISYIHHSLTIFSDELTVFLTGFDSKQLITDITDLFDSKDTWSYRTEKDGKIDINNVYINLIGLTTPDLIKTLPIANTIGGGLASRIVFVYEEKNMPRQSFTGFINTPRGKILHEGLRRDLADIYQLSGDFKISSNYMACYHEWYSNLPYDCPFDPNRFQGYWERKAMHLRKLSMILSVARNSDLFLEEEDFVEALALLNATEENMPKVFGGIGNAPESIHIQTMMTFIARQRKLSYSDLVRHFMNDLNRDQIGKMISTLQIISFIECKRSSQSSGDFIIEYTPEKAQAKKLKK